MTGRRVAFVDRDGTLNEERHYLGDPADVSLIEGSAGAIARLNAAGVVVVVVSNQSGVARGLFDLDAVERVNERLTEFLAEEGARVDAWYVCPHHPDFTGPCPCRKPGTELHRRAVRALDLTLQRSIAIGDSVADVEAGFALGIPTALVLTGHGRRSAEAFPDPHGRLPGVVVPDLASAVDWYLASYRDDRSDEATN